MTATITRLGVFDMQVCVPAEWTDKQIIRFANGQNPAGTELGWQIRREGDPLLAGARERVQCEKDPAQVHVMLDWLREG